MGRDSSWLEMLMPEAQPPRTEPMIQALGLTKRFGDDAAVPPATGLASARAIQPTRVGRGGNPTPGASFCLDHVTFDVYPGQVFCLLGAKGAGKTTLLNLFLDLLEPTEGEARINGIDCHGDPMGASQYAAYASAETMLYGHFTALQNLKFFARLDGKRNLSRDGGEQILAAVGLPPDAFDRPVGELSKAMHRSLVLALALSKDSPALLLDEPMACLDSEAAFAFGGLLSRLRAQGKSVLVATEDITECRQIADRVGVLTDGKLVAQFDRSELSGLDLSAILLGDFARPATA